MLSVGLATLLTVARSETMTVSLDYLLSDFEINYGADSLFYLTSTKHTLTFGNDTTTPALPIIPITVAIPTGKSYMGFTYTSSESLVLEGKCPEKNSESVPTSEVPIAYAASYPDYAPVSYPATAVENSGSSRIENISVAYFLISPFRYDAAAKKLYLNNSISLTLNLATVSESAGNTAAPLPEHLRELLSDVCINSDEVEALKAPATLLNKNRDITGDLDYVIITSRQFAKAFEPLRSWKTKKGVRTEIKCVEDIYAQYSSATRQEKIKQFLYDSYKNRGLKYALLGGDHNTVPVFNCHVVANSRYEDDIPTDLYYSCFDAEFNWNKNGNDVNGEIDDNINCVPEIYVTRMPARTSTDVDEFVKKIMAYERGESIDSSNSYQTSILLTGSKLDEGCKIHIAKTDSECMLDALYRQWIRPYSNITKESLFDAPLVLEPKLNVESLTSELSKGYKFVSFNSHGNTSLWRLHYSTVSTQSKYFWSNNVKNIKNKGFSVITTSACTTSKFDDRDICLGEAFISKKESGVIAYIGSSRYGWHRKGHIHSTISSLDYEGSFYKHIFNSNLPSISLGKSSALMKMEYIPKINKNQIYRWLQFSINPFGDPETPIYKTIPEKPYQQRIEKTDKGIKVTGSPSSILGSPTTVTVMSLEDEGRSYYKVLKGRPDKEFDCGDIDVSVCVIRDGHVPYMTVVKADTEYIQNQTFDSDIEISRKKVVIGEDVTTRKEKGKVEFRKGKISIEAEETVIESGTEIGSEAEFQIK